MFISSESQGHHDSMKKLLAMPPRWLSTPEVLAIEVVLSKITSMAEDLPTQNFCRLKKKKSNLYSAQELWLFPRSVNYPWMSCCPSCRARHLPVANRRNHFHSFLPTTLISGVLVAGFFLCPHFLIPHFPISLPSTTNVQRWQGRDELHPVFSLSCASFPWPPPREGQAETPSLCDQVQCSCPLFPCYFQPQTSDFLGFSYSPE